MQVSFAPIAFIAEAMSKRKRGSSASQLVGTQTGPADDSLQQKDDMELLLAVAARKLGITTAGVDITVIRQQLHQQLEAGLAEEQPLISPTDVHDLQQQVARLQTQVLRQQEERRKAHAVGGETETRMRNSTVRTCTPGVVLYVSDFIALRFSNNLRIHQR